LQRVRTQILFQRDITLSLFQRLKDQSLFQRVPLVKAPSIPSHPLNFLAIMVPLSWYLLGQPQTFCLVLVHPPYPSLSLPLFPGPCGTPIFTSQPQVVAPRESFVFYWTPGEIQWRGGIVRFSSLLSVLL